MLANDKLSKSFWGETMRMVVDLINLTPIAPLVRILQRGLEWEGCILQALESVWLPSVCSYFKKLEVQA